jgi:hypothetical protein
VHHSIAGCICRSAQKARMCTSTLRVGFERVIATIERLKTATTVIDCKMKVSSSVAGLITLSNYRFARLLDDAA